MRTYSTKAGDITHEWHLVDAKGKVLGRLATEIAVRLQGKHKPIYVPHLDTGDFMVVVNADRLRLTGRKASSKVYYRHTGYIGGLKVEKFADRMAQRPEEVLRDAVRGMLPKNRIGRAMLKKLKIYSGPEHPHEAQKPHPLEI